MARSLAGSLSVFLAMSALAGCDPGGWKLVDSGTTKTLRGVFVEAPDRIYVTGDEGTVLLYDGEKITDTSTIVGTQFFKPNFYGIAASRGEVAIAGDGGAVLTRTLSEWTRDQSNTSQRLLTMIRPAASRFYAAGESGRVITRGAGETAWEHIDTGAPRGAKITGGWGINNQTIVFSTDRGVVLELIAGGWVAQTVATETSTAPVPLFGVWSSTKGADLVAVGLGGSIFRRREGSMSWAQEDARISQDLYGVFGNARDRVFAVGARGSILRYDGSAWAPAPSGTSNDLFAVHGLADGSVIAAVGARGTIVILRGP